MINPLEKLPQDEKEEQERIEKTRHIIHWAIFAFTLFGYLGMILTTYPFPKTTYLMIIFLGIGIITSRVAAEPIWWKH